MATNFTTGTISSEEGDVDLISIRPVYDENTQIGAFGQLNMPQGSHQLGFSESIAALNQRSWGIFRFVTRGNRE